MMPEQPKEDDTFLKAMAFIDPSHTLVLGAETYDSIRDMFLGWIDQFGPDYILDMAKKGANHLEMWQKYPLGGLFIGRGRDPLPESSPIFKAQKKAAPQTGAAAFIPSQDPCYRQFRSFQEGMVFCCLMY